MAEALGEADWAGGIMTVNTSLIRECLELILLLADALDRSGLGRPQQFRRIRSLQHQRLRPLKGWKQFATDAQYFKHWRCWPRSAPRLVAGEPRSALPRNDIRRVSERMRRPVKQFELSGQHRDTQIRLGAREIRLKCV
jgi:hypothetical protein